MCISDYRIGRLIRSQLDVATVAVGTPITIPPHQDRVGIIINTSTVFLVVTSFLAVTVGGVCVGKLWSSAPTIAFLLKEHGDLCTREFVLTAVGGTHTCGVVQQFLPESAIGAAIEEFKRGH